MKPGLNESDLEIFANGVYGHVENVWEKKSRKQGKGKYLFSRLFPSLSVMRTGYPILAKLPVLLPFCWIARMFRGMFRRRKQIVREFRYVTESVKDPKRLRCKDRRLRAGKQRREVITENHPAFNEKTVRNIRTVLGAGGGFEPTRHRWQRILSPPRLPISNTPAKYFFCGENSGREK